jgi:hypothetical protein
MPVNGRYADPISTRNDLTTIDGVIVIAVRQNCLSLITPFDAGVSHNRTHVGRHSGAWDLPDSLPA